MCSSKAYASFMNFMALVEMTGRVFIFFALFPEDEATLSSQRCVSSAGQ